MKVCFWEWLGQLRPAPCLSTLLLAPMPKAPQGPDIYYTASQHPPYRGSVAWTPDPANLPNLPSDFQKGLAPLVVVKWALKTTTTTTKQEEKLLMEMEDLVHPHREHQPNKTLPFNSWGQRKGWQQRAVRPTTHPAGQTLLSIGPLPCTKLGHTMPKHEPLERERSNAIENTVSNHVKTITSMISSLCHWILFRKIFLVLLFVNTIDFSILVLLKMTYQF